MGCFLVSGVKEYELALENEEGMSKPLKRDYGEKLLNPEKEKETPK